jgi:hypothetical protein
MDSNDVIMYDEVERMGKERVLTFLDTFCCLMMSFGVILTYSSGYCRVSIDATAGTCDPSL